MKATIQRLRSDRRRPPAFTLIELLVVIGIIALLAAMLFPVLSRARCRAHQVSCLNNVKQLTTAILLYAADNGGTFCAAGINSDESPSGAYFWMQNLAGQGGNVDSVRLCPSTPNRPAMPGGGETSAWGLGNADTPWCFGCSSLQMIQFWKSNVAMGSYGINWWLNADPTYATTNNASARYSFRKETAVQKPTQTPAFVDCSRTLCSPSETAPPSRNLYQPQLVSGISQCVIARHGSVSASRAPRDFTNGVLPGAINVGFTDGHAQTVKLENLWTLYWHKDWDPSLVPWPHPPPQ